MFGGFVPGLPEQVFGVAYNANASYRAAPWRRGCPRPRRKPPDATASSSVLSRSFSFAALMISIRSGWIARPASPDIDLRMVRFLPQNRPAKHVDWGRFPSPDRTTKKRKPRAHKAGAFSPSQLLWLIALAIPACDHHAALPHTSF
jgi:hypothetical protein